MHDLVRAASGRHLHYYTIKTGYADRHDSLSCRKTFLNANTAAITTWLLSLSLACSLFLSLSLSLYPSLSLSLPLSLALSLALALTLSPFSFIFFLTHFEQPMPFRSINDADWACALYKLCRKGNTGVEPVGDHTGK